MESFKTWLESEYTRDILSYNTDWNHPDVLDRINASSAFLGGIPRNPTFIDKNLKYPPETRTPIQIPENKRIVVSSYRQPPIVTPIKISNVNAGKPIGGLWYAFGDGWLYFAHIESPTKINMFIHEIYVNKPKIAMLHTEKDVEDFESKYGQRRINWKAVMKDYDGIEITGDALHRDNWQEAWDIPSGCIWNKNGLLDSKLLFVYNVKTKTYVKPDTLGLYAGKSTKIKNPIT